MGDYTQVPTSPADVSTEASLSAVVSTKEEAKVDPVATPSAQPDASASDPNRPVSTISADLSPEALANEDSSEATPSAQPQPADVSTEASSKDGPPVQVPTSELQPNQVLEGSASASIVPPADVSTEASASRGSQPVTPTAPIVSDVPAQVVPPVQVEPPASPVSVPPEAPKESVIQDQPPSNQPSQVQPETPENTPVMQGENASSQSAGIKSEPPQGTQNAPSAVSKNTESPKPTSFGDLMGTPADLSEEPALHIDPIEAPKETIPVSQSSDQQQKEEFTQRRQRANAVRKQKKDGNLVQILEFVQKKGTVKNLDVRDFLHISQTTATDYLRTLVNSGKLKKAGKAKATVYSL